MLIPVLLVIIINLLISIPIIIKKLKDKNNFKITHIYIQKIMFIYAIIIYFTLIIVTNFVFATIIIIITYPTIITLIAVEVIFIERIMRRKKNSKEIVY